VFGVIRRRLQVRRSIPAELFHPVVAARALRRGKAFALADLNQAALAQQIKNAEEDLADAKSDEARDRAQTTLDQLKALAAAI
jgi:F-type H+-transporting ATPase subunit epsilon